MNPVRGNGFILYISLSLHAEKEDLKVDASIQVGHRRVWQPGGTSFTERQTGSVRAAGEEREAQWACERGVTFCPLAEAR